MKTHPRLKWGSREAGSLKTTHNRLRGRSIRHTAIQYIGIFMSFDKEYPNRKDHRKKYYRSKAFDRSCRCHGGCPQCEGNRLYSDKKNRHAADEQIKEYKELS